MPLFHFDMYRLDSADDLFDIGWEDYLARGGVCAVEWSENVEEALSGAIRITIHKDPADENVRTITIEGGERFADVYKRQAQRALPERRYRLRCGNEPPARSGNSGMRRRIARQSR